MADRKVTYKEPANYFNDGMKKAAAKWDKEHKSASNQDSEEGDGIIRSGFSAPTIGTVYPRGTMLRKNPDGTVTPILPEGYETEEEN